MGILVTLLYIVFIASCIVLILVILLQEGKGGGLSEAFGGVGGETFGHRAGGVNKVTSGLAAVMIVVLVLIHTLRTESKTAGLLQVKEQPAAVGGAGAAGPQGPAVGPSPTVPQSQPGK
jgi:preprotein translocase subunit SecG